MICKNGIKLSQDDFPVYTLIKFDRVRRWLVIDASSLVQIPVADTT